ncbi:hypothetical protein BHE74_00046738, partial [Ensete ventricosum]
SALLSPTPHFRPLIAISLRRLPRERHRLRFLPLVVADFWGFRRHPIRGRVAWLVSVFPDSLIDRRIVAPAMSDKFSPALRLADLNDFIAPSQDCIVSLKAVKAKHGKAEVRVSSWGFADYRTHSLLLMRTLSPGCVPNSFLSLLVLIRHIEDE